MGITTLTTAGPVVFDQQSDVVWVGQYNNCGDGVRAVGQTKMDVGNLVGAC